MTNKLSRTRRSVLRGMVGGVGVTVALPLLDCFLNSRGTAFASGGQLPVRFGTWFWGLGITPQRYVPTKTGPDYDLTPELQPIASVKEKVSIMTGFNVRLDGLPQVPHVSGGSTFRTGIPFNPEKGGLLMGPSFDVLVADAISSRSRFRSLDLSASLGSFPLSGRGPGNMNPAESSATAFYNRLFGSEFRDPNAAGFTVDPAVVVRKSVLSGVSEQRRALVKLVGTSDRARLDQYFTSLRQVENQLAMQLEPPEPMVGCQVPAPPTEVASSTNVEIVKQNHEIMAKLLAMALMCDQSRVFNIFLTGGQSELTRLGSTVSHHSLTHEELIDPTIGYQPKVSKFVEDIMGAWGTFLHTMDSFSEGDGTLLDHMLVVAHSETCYARFHTVENLPIMLAGRAGGRVSSGHHIAGKGDSVSRVVFTALQAMGLSIDHWGTGSSETNNPISEILA